MWGQWASLGGYGMPQQSGGASNQQLGWVSPAARGVQRDYSALAPGKLEAMQQRPVGMAGGQTAMLQGGLPMMPQQNPQRGFPGVGYGVPNFQAILAQIMGNAGPQWGMPAGGAQPMVPGASALPMNPSFMPQPTPQPVAQPQPMPAPAPAPTPVARPQPMPQKPWPQPQPQPAAPVQEPLGRKLLSRGYWASR